MKKCIDSILAVIVGGIIGVAWTRRKMESKFIVERGMSDKHLSLFLMMNQWVKVKQEGKKLSSYFELRGYYEIAIYGMSYAGETLSEELKASAIVIKYGIDKRAESIYADFKIVTPDEKLDKVDAVVVTSIKFFDEIEEQLSQRLTCPIISLEDILYEI